MGPRHRLLGLLAGVGLLAAAHPAYADFSLALGVRWTPVNNTIPVSTSGAGAPNTVLSGWNTTNLNNYFGMFFLDGRLGFQLGLDLGYSSRHDESIAMAGGITKSDLSFTQFGFSLGGKFYFLQPRGGHVSPYMYLDFYKYFASISTSATVPKGYEGYLAGLVSPLGIDVAVGAEYFVTPGFSIGAEVLGLRYAYTEGDFPTTAGGIGGSGNVTQTNHYVTFYTGLSLNYRFDIAASVRVKEAGGDEADEPRPKRKKKDAPPPESQPSEPPPASPESVD